MRESLKSAFRFFLQHPIQVGSIQLPLASLILLQNYVGSTFEQRPWIALLILLPLYSILSSFSMAATYLLMKSTGNKDMYRLGAITSPLLKASRPLILSSLVLSVFFALGMAAFLIPGLYFMAVYLFVPFLIMDHPNRPIFEILFESKRQVTRSRNTLLSLFFLVILLFSVELLRFFLMVRVSDLFGTPNSGILFDVAFNMTTGGFIDCFIVCYYLAQRKTLPTLQPGT